MLKVPQLTLMTGTDVIINNGTVRIVQPTLEEIALLGEGEFFRLMSIFYIDSKPLEEFVNEVPNLTEEEKRVFLEDATEYENLMFLLKLSIDDNGNDTAGFLELAKQSLNFIIPDMDLFYNTNEGILFLVNRNNSKTLILDRELFLEIKSVAAQLFSLDSFFNSGKEVEMSETARKIAEKMAKTEKKIQELKGEEKVESYFGHLISIMGMHADLSTLSKYTIYQLQNQFERYNLYTNYQQSVQAALAGASEIEFVDWYKNL